MIGLIGKKVGMTRLFGPNGESIPATAILAGPCHVIQVKTDQREGYRSIQLGAFDRRKKLVKKPQLGHFTRAKVEPKSKLAEFRVENTDLFQPGQELRVDIFQVGDRVKITGTSKGKGFAGGVKRHGFHGGPKTHGQSDRHRAPGSLGGSSYPSRVWKGQRMAGRMGGDQVSTLNMEVVLVDLENNLILVKGAVPGARNGHVMIQRTTELMKIPVAGERPDQDHDRKKSSDQTAAAGSAAPEKAQSAAGKVKTVQKMESAGTDAQPAHDAGTSTTAGEGLGEEHAASPKESTPSQETREPSDSE